MNKTTEQKLNEAIRPLPELKVHGDDVLLLVRLTLSRHKVTAPGSCFETNQYDAVRGCWKLDLKQALKVDYVLGVDKDPQTGKSRVCSVLVLDKQDPLRCEQLNTDDYGIIFDDKPRIRFKGKLDNTLDYFCTDVSRFEFGRSSVHYITK